MPYFSVQHSQCLSVVLLLILVTSGCSTTRLGSMTIDETFENPAVARLVEAALDGQAQEIQTLVKQGVDVNYVGKDDITPLLWVIGSRSTTGMKQLLSVGADLNLKTTRSRISAVNFAAGADDPEFLKILLEHGGGDLDLANVDGYSPLQVAVQQDRLENVKRLIQYGADIHRSGGVGRSSTAAETAVKLNRFDIAVYMLEQGYNHDLQRLARLSEGPLNPDSDQNQWKLKLQEMLKQRGVKFPAYVPKKTKPVSER